MPIYEYACTKCGKLHEVMQKITEKPLEICPDCGGELKKMISNTSFVLKGSGWYATDYASGKKDDKGKPGKEAKETKETKEHGLTAESRKAEETKPAAAAEKKSDSPGTAAS